MPKCLNCGKSGIFLKLTKIGVCERCFSEIRIITESRFRIFKESAEIVRTTNNPSTLKNRIERVREQLSVFITFENKNIHIMTPTASEQLSLLKTENDEYYQACFQRLFDDMAIKVANMKVKSAQINRINKFLQTIEEYIPDLNITVSLTQIQKKAEKLKNNYQS